MILTLSLFSMFLPIKSHIASVFQSASLPFPLTVVGNFFPPMFYWSRRRPFVALLKLQLCDFGSLSGLASQSGESNSSIQDIRGACHLWHTRLILVISKVSDADGTDMFNFNKVALFIISFHLATGYCDTHCYPSPSKINILAQYHTELDRGSFYLLSNRVITQYFLPILGYAIQSHLIC